MQNVTEEEIIMEQLSEIEVNLNRLSQQILEITCTRRIPGGYGQARRYASEQDATAVLLAFGIDAETIDASFVTLREVNEREIKPQELVCVGKYHISNDTLCSRGFIAV